jgi:hypothetical protein
MTFLENLEPLLKAAEEYAKAVSALEPQRLLAAEAKLHEAAVQYAKWGKWLYITGAISSGAENENGKSPE